MPEKVTLHRNDGSTAEMEAVDARRALLEHPSEWSSSPFPANVVKASKANAVDADAEAEAKRKADEEARAKGTSDQVLPTQPLTNDGLKIGHIPSEVPALEAPVAPFEAREKGRGWWAIYDSKGTQIGGGIREADGVEFNKFSEEEKQEYVNAELAKS